VSSGRVRDIDTQLVCSAVTTLRLHRLFNHFPIENRFKPGKWYGLAQGDELVHVRQTDRASKSLKAPHLIKIELALSTSIYFFTDKKEIQTSKVKEVERSDNEAR